MRMAELSERSGTPVPTIKYYLREGLLPRGERTGRNQARYSEEHLRRLRLVRALTDVGGLPIAAVREILSRVDSPGTSTHRLLGHTLASLPPPVKESGDVDEEDVKRVQDMAGRLGWHVYPGTRKAIALAEVVATYRRAGHPLSDTVLDRYAAVAEHTARVDLDVIAGISETDEILESTVVHIVLGDTLMAVLRRLAQTNESARRSGAVADDG